MATNVVEIDARENTKIIVKVSSSRTSPNLRLGFNVPDLEWVIGEPGIIEPDNKRRQGQAFITHATPRTVGGETGKKYLAVSIERLNDRSVPVGIAMNNGSDTTCKLLIAASHFGWQEWSYGVNHLPAELVTTDNGKRIARIELPNGFPAQGVGAVERVQMRARENSRNTGHGGDEITKQAQRELVWLDPARGLLPEGAYARGFKLMTLSGSDTHEFELMRSRIGDGQQVADIVLVEEIPATMSNLTTALEKKAGLFHPTTFRGCLSHVHARVPKQSVIALHADFCGTIQGKKFADEVRRAMSSGMLAPNARVAVTFHRGRDAQTVDMLARTGGVSRNEAVIGMMTKGAEAVGLVPVGTHCYDYQNNHSPMTTVIMQLGPLVGGVTGTSPDDGEADGNGDADILVPTMLHEMDDEHAVAALNVFASDRGAKWIAMVENPAMPGAYLDMPVVVMRRLQRKG